MQDNAKTQVCQEPCGTPEDFLTAAQALAFLRNSPLRVRSRDWLKVHRREIVGLKRIRHRGRKGGFEYRIPLAGLQELINARLEDGEQPLSAAEICAEETRGHSA